MDTEKLLELEHKIEQGESLSDEGPYYHHAKWESYKGASKGELGGTVVGIAIGAAMGIAAGAAVALMAGSITAAVPVVLAFTGGGLIYGVHKFTNIGAVTGAVSSVAHQGEARMRAFEEGKFSEIKHEINELKALVKGEPAPSKAPLLKEQAALKEDLDNYRKTHYAKLDTPVKNRYVFWKIALMGLVVGAAAGALLAAASASGALAGVIGGHAIEFAPAMLAFGALGASLGINRDVFRKIFDKTDLWFKGIFGGKQHGIVEAKQIEAGESIRKSTESEKAPEIATLTTPYEGPLNYPTSNTYHRDKLAAAAEKALLSLDHTRATPQ